MAFVSVIIPFFNEQENIYELYTRLSFVLKKISEDYEIICVNDGSKDDTLRIIEEIAGKDDRLKYISFSRNFGHQVALFAGLEKCKGESVILMDGDLQDPPEVIEELMEKMKNGFNIVYSCRYRRF